MMRNPHIVQAFERELVRRDKPDYHRNLELFKAMVRQAVKLGALPPQNRLEGIEDDIRLIQAINSLRL